MSRSAAAVPVRLAAAAALLAAAAVSCGPEPASRSAEAGSSAPSGETGPAATGPVPSIGAVTVDARDAPEPSMLDRLAELGASHVTLVGFGFQESAGSTEIRMHTEGGWYSESDEGIRSLARKARARGMGVILKPHLWVGERGQGRPDIAFGTEEEWRAWTRDYRRFLMHYARLAEEVDARILVVGTELRGVVGERPDFWRDLIREIRTEFGGELTYAANWYEEYREVPFWDRLDYVGVQGYFPLADEPDPPLELLREAWTEHGRELARLSRETERPVLFTEIGYRSVGYAAARPWEWPERGESEPPAPALQARLYRAFSETVAREPWFAGAVVWKWHPDAEGDRPLGFTPQGKPAEEVIRRWFTGGS